MSNRITTTALTAVLILVDAAASARASLVVTVLNARAAPGDSGAFDVTINNTGPAPIPFVSFQLELSVEPNSGVHFTDATRDTKATYVFASSPGQFPFSYDKFPNVDLSTSDGYRLMPENPMLGVGETFGLEHVSFSVDPGTPFGSVGVSILPYDYGTGDGTLLLFNDSGRFSLDYTAVNGTIQVALPEPSTLLLAGVGGSLLLLRIGLGRRESR
jgi:hypothetical protein